MTNPFAPTTRLAERLGEVPLLDHHCHGIFRGQPGDALVLDHLTEAPSARSARTSPLESSLGLAVRAALAHVLDREGPLEPEEYLEERRRLEHGALLRRALERGGTRALLVDTGLRSEELLGPAELEDAGGVPTREIVRLEPLAEAVISRLASPTEFAEAFCDAVRARSAGVVGYKSVAAYRSGLDVPPSLAAPRAREAALVRLLRERDAGRPVRLRDRTLIGDVLWLALTERPRSLQLHVGLGDPDVRLARGRPGLLQPFLEAVAGRGVNVVLLHTYPYHREAALLAHDYPHVFVDVGLALSFVGEGATRVLAEVLELAPWGKLCYSSDAFGLAELYALGAVTYRRSLARYLGGLLDEGWIAEREAFHLARLIAYENALALYALPWPLAPYAEATS